LEEQDGEQGRKKNKRKAREHGLVGERSLLYDFLGLLNIPEPLFPR
jgi:hypothetical protein